MKKIFCKAVYQERAYELAFEGHRRMDLIRWGIYYETIQKTYNDLLNWWTAETEFNYVVYRHTVKGKHDLFPIPQRDMDLMIKFIKIRIGNSPHSLPICLNYGILEKIKTFFNKIKLEKQSSNSFWTILQRKVLPFGYFCISYKTSKNNHLK